MKKHFYLLVLLFVFLFSQGTPVLATGKKNISLKGRVVKTPSKNMGPISAEGQLDGRILSINFDGAISDEQVAITITNDEGEVIFNDVVYVQSDALFLYFDEEGKQFFIDISSEKVSFYGLID